MGASVSPRGGGGGKRRRGHAKNRPMAEINVTPFVDVMLVLLIIFMVAAPMLTVGVPIELPKSAAQPLATEQEEPLTIALSSEGKIVLQNIEIKNENLIEKLVAVAEERTKDTKEACKPPHAARRYIRIFSSHDSHSHRSSKGLIYTGSEGRCG